MNNLYEFGGVCDVIIKCNSERQIGNKTYDAGEPYTILNDVYVNLGYKNIISDGGAKNNIIAHRVGLPDIVNISGLTLTDKVCDLIATRVTDTVITKACEVIGDNTKIYMPEQYIHGSVFVYYKNERITNFTEHNDYLNGSFQSGEKYLIFYSIKVDNCSFNFNTPTYGYFSLDICGKGNLNKKTKDIYLNFPAVSLMSVPVFDLVNGNILNAPLQFECIHKAQKNSTFKVGD